MINVEDIGIEFKISGWNNVKRMALETIHKKWTGSEITSEWKVKMALCEHSPLRQLRVELHMEPIPRWIADQLVRHNVGVDNYMGTMRSDRGNIPRSEQSMEHMTTFTQVYNGVSFINMCSIRSCIGCVSKETRQLVNRIIREMWILEPEIALMCVPPCIKRLGCKEIGFTSCKHLMDFLEFREFSPGSLFDIVNRYNDYALFEQRVPVDAIPLTL